MGLNEFHHQKNALPNENCQSTSVEWRREIFQYWLDKLCQTDTHTHCTCQDGYEYIQMTLSALSGILHRHIPSKQRASICSSRYGNSCRTRMASTSAHLQLTFRRQWLISALYSLSWWRLHSSMRTRHLKWACFTSTNLNSTSQAQPSQNWPILFKI